MSKNVMANASMTIEAPKRMVWEETLITPAVLLVAFAALFSVLWTGTYSAAAESARSTADPAVYPESDGQMGNDFFPPTGKGAEAAKAAVRNRCSDAFCTIQIQRSTRRYEVYWLSGCDTFRLSHFKGRFLAHNGGSLRVDLLDSSRKAIYRLWGGGKTRVNWGPVYYIRTCNR
ncbi:MAG: hypothetical protein OJF51_000602 [Nitrospira sp.]|jgi:hypothetical protein|nr:MAG: hypothetical protein OJF51_000602 [Nitrospira sp.]